MKKICIIGCGTYGAYLAKRLVEKHGPGAQITVIEIGNEKTRDESETGIEAESPISRAAQLGRYFGLGGTSARWGGQVLFFDERDLFECKMQNAECGIDPKTAVWEEIVGVCQQFRAAVLGNLLGGNSGKFEKLLDGGGSVRTGIWMKYSKRNTFKLLGKKALAPEVSGQAVEILKDLRVTDFVFDQKKVTAVVCKSADGAQKNIEADQFYLTAGAIESCRLLLEINEKHGGVFSAKDLGRNFGDHISVPVFKIKGHPPVVAGQSLLPIFLDGSLVTKRIVVRDAQGRVGFAHPIFNEEVRVFSSIKKMLFGKMKVDFSLRDVVTGVEFLARFGFSVLFLKKMYAHRNDWTLRLDIEQAFPNENRVLLSEKKDRFGQKAARLDWQVSATDRQSIEEIKSDLAVFFKKEGIPFSEIDAAADGGAKVEDVYHPAGFLRMGHDDDAPLDMACRVRGTENLWHFSTAMFPTAKSINPTAAGFCFIEKHLSVP